MQNRTKAGALAIGALLALAALNTNVLADSVIEIDDALATEITQKLRLEAAEGGHNLTGVIVQAKDGVLRLRGFIGDVEERRVVTKVLESIEGLHVDQVDDHLFRSADRRP